MHIKNLFSVPVLLKLALLFSALSVIVAVLGFKFLESHQALVGVYFFSLTSLCCSIAHCLKSDREFRSRIQKMTSTTQPPVTRQGEYPCLKNP
jgi:hypothetical protein